MVKKEDKGKLMQQHRSPSNNKGNSQSMKTLQTTATDINPDPNA